MSNMVIETTASVNLDDVVHDLNADEAKRLILAVDLAQADGDFSLDIIKSLVHSLFGDYNRKDIRDFLKELRKEFK